MRLKGLSVNYKLKKGVQRKLISNLEFQIGTDNRSLCRDRVHVPRNPEILQQL